MVLSYSNDGADQIHNGKLFKMQMATQDYRRVVM
jgi:hypothetical protein